MVWDRYPFPRVGAELGDACDGHHHGHHQSPNSLLGPFSPQRASTLEIASGFPGLPSNLDPCGPLKMLSSFDATACSLSTVSDPPWPSFRKHVPASTSALALARWRSPHPLDSSTQHLDTHLQGYDTSDTSDAAVLNVVDEIESGRMDDLLYQDPTDQPAGFSDEHSMEDCAMHDSSSGPVTSNYSNSSVAAPMLPRSLSVHSAPPTPQHAKADAHVMAPAASCCNSSLDFSMALRDFRTLGAAPAAPVPLSQPQQADRLSGSTPGIPTVLSCYATGWQCNNHTPTTQSGLDQAIAPSTHSPCMPAAGYSPATTIACCATPVPDNGYLTQAERSNHRSCGGVAASLHQSCQPASAEPPFNPSALSTSLTLVRTPMSSGWGHQEMTYGHGKACRCAACLELLRPVLDLGALKLELPEEQLDQRQFGGFKEESITPRSVPPGNAAFDEEHRSFNYFNPADYQAGWQHACSAPTSPVHKEMEDVDELPRGVGSHMGLPSQPSSALQSSQGASRGRVCREAVLNGQRHDGEAHSTKAVLHNMFHLPFQVARAELGLSKNGFKRLLGRYGFKRWPHRQVAGLRRLLENTMNDEILSSAQRQARVDRINLNLDILHNGSVCAMFHDLHRACHVYHNRQHLTRCALRATIETSQAARPASPPAGYSSYNL